MEKKKSVCSYSQKLSEYYFDNIWLLSNGSNNIQFILAVHAWT